MTRRLLKVVTGLTLILTCNVPALAQERLLLFHRSPFGTTVSEIDTADSSLGSVRRVAPLPSILGLDLLGPHPLAGGRFLILKFSRGFAVFDTRTFTTFTLPQSSSLQASFIVSFESDALRPRIFYRTLTEFGVMEGPSFIPRVLGPTGDAVVGWGSLKYVAASNLLLLPRFVSYTRAQIVGVDADSGAVRGVIELDGWLGPMMVDTVPRLHVPIAIGGIFYGAAKLQTYDLGTFCARQRNGDLPGRQRGGLEF